MLRATVLVVALALIAVGGFLILSATTSSSTPQDQPKPADRESAWTHVCLGSMNDPTWCEDI